MRFRYRSEEEMKDSGVEWIGRIPSEWEVKRLKQVISEPLKYGANESAELDDRNLPRYIRITDFDQDGTLKDETFKSLSYEKAKDYYLKEGDILFARSGATVGKTFLFKKYEGKACFAGYLIKATANEKKIENEFLYRFTQSKGYENWKNSVFMQATIQNIGADKYKELKLALSNKKDQKKIVNFLEKIIQFDTIISKKEALIQTLEEAKKSLISEAVTGKVKVVKTTDGYELVERKKEEMKDSGVEWLGDIPKEWEIKKIKYVASLKSGDSITSDNIRDEGKYPVYGGNGLRGYTDKYTHNGNYILIGRQGALCGNINYAENKFWASEHAVVVTPIKDVQLLWIGELFRSMNFNQYSISAAQPGLSVSMIQNLHMPYTKLEDQKIISNYISIKLSKINSTINKTKKQIQKLKEAKQALISEAVTGKIEILD